MTFYPLASPTDVEEAARLSRYNPGFSGATLSGCSLDGDGNVVLSVSAGTTANITDPDTTLGPHIVKSGIRITANTTLGGVRVALAASTADITKAYIIKHSDGTVIATKDITGIGTTPFDIVGTMETGTDYRIVIDNGGSNYTNRVKNSGVSYPYSSDDITAVSGSYDGGDQPTIIYAFDYITALLPNLSGTVTEDIAVSSLQQWYKYHRNVTEPANTSVSCAVKDTSDNVLDASVADGDSLSAIDETLYKTIRLVHTLTRNSTSDATPKLHYREVSWLGAELINDKKGYSAYIINSTTAYALVGEYSGSGVASLVVQKTTAGNALYNITIDGVATEVTITYASLSGHYRPLLSDLSGIASSVFGGAIGDILNILSTTTSLAFPIVFKNSLKVEVKSSDANSAAAILYTEVYE